jgi:hypothetical protein
MALVMGAEPCMTRVLATRNECVPNSLTGDCLVMGMGPLTECILAALTTWTTQGPGRKSQQPMFMDQGLSR